MWNGKWRAALDRMGKICRATKRLLDSLSTADAERVRRFRQHIIDLRDYLRSNRSGLKNYALERRKGPEDLERSGRVCHEPFGQSEDGQTSADALVLRGCPPLVAGSLRRSRQAVGHSLPRVAPQLPEATGCTTSCVTAPTFEPKNRSQKQRQPVGLCFREPCPRGNCGTRRSE